MTLHLFFNCRIRIETKSLFSVIFEIHFLSMKTHLIIFIFVLISSISVASNTEKRDDKSQVPPRIIRTCCAFGYDIGYVVVPFFKHNDVTEVSALGEHHYLGGRSEGNGIVYSYRGGFIDVGHLRDQADWTRFLFNQLNEAQVGDTLSIKLGYEGGPKWLHLFNSENLTRDDRIALAARVAYDLSVWHEIATWFGASTVPFVPERYSSFSVEDSYSNLMGATLAMRALRSSQPYNEAMTNQLQLMLDTLEVVDSMETTMKAMDLVYNTWWTRSYRFPSTSVLQMRDVNPYHGNRPYLVPGMESVQGPYVLSVPQVTVQGDSLLHFYSLDFKLNRKFPVKELFPERDSRRITQNDFQRMIWFVNQDVENRVKPPRPRHMARMEKRNR